MAVRRLTYLLAHGKAFSLAVSERVHRDNDLWSNSAFSPLTDLLADVLEPRFLDVCHASETANREIPKRIAEHVNPLVSSRGRRAGLTDSHRGKKAAAGTFGAEPRPVSELSQATFRARWQALFGEFQH